MHLPSSALLRNLRRSLLPQTLRYPFPARACTRPLHTSSQSTPTRPSLGPFRGLTTSTHRSFPPPSNVPATTDRGPVSDEDTQTDFSSMNVLGNTPAPTTAIDACLSHGFHLDNGIKIGGGSGCLLVAGEAFGWTPWSAPGSGTPGKGPKSMVNAKGQWQAGEAAWGILEVVWPKPDLLILGLGPSMLPIAPETRRWINELGIRVDVQDTRNAAAQFNLLATERGAGEVAAALIPIGWREPRG
ncbi:MAG: hypothetical protein LQ344_006001 [Seirophora lacunosa]|nr:MAG: hypothetical protein LQ344_006001 [Seirophora lacunosa]